MGLMSYYCLTEKCSILIQFAAKDIKQVNNKKVKKKASSNNLGKMLAKKFKLLTIL